MKRAVRIGSLLLGQSHPMFLIAGPCVIESESHALMMARRLSAAARRLGIPYIFKASFDKANRTSSSSYRGPGLDRGLEILAAVRKKVGVPVLTDIHEVSQAAAAARVCDVLQIPAFLCRQTDLLEAAGRSGAAINIKKGQFVSPWEMRNAVEKIERSEEHTSELQSPVHLVCRLLLETTVHHRVLHSFPTRRSSDLIHEVSQAAAAARVCDVLQIPAFLCRQTDLLEAAGRSGAAINIKKGQFVSPWEMRNAVEKIE